MPLKKADAYLAAICILILSPIAGMFLYKTEIYDVLTYFSFTLASWGAIYAGRGVFNLLEKEAIAPQETDSPNEMDVQRNFWTGLMFIILAAIALMPTMFRKNTEFIYYSIVSSLVITIVAYLYCGIKNYVGDSKMPFLRAISWIIMPTIGLFLLLLIYKIHN
ncbi:hypothetical protein [Janthinobacterium sp. RA13]|uniref:hypothetical protein n=1 Tax=Janthinobacterium sp. RA13 TaxID=1502762 RepID=UPI000565BA28|nr:hypothetical protein [Janthinobacterium sp. RA13]